MFLDHSEQEKEESYPEDAAHELQTIDKSSVKIRHERKDHGQYRKSNRYDQYDQGFAEDFFPLHSLIMAGNIRFDRVLAGECQLAHDVYEYQ